MVEILLQYGNGLFAPYTLDCQEAAKEFKQNQTIKARLTGAQNPRSLKQLGTYWKLCRMMSDNSSRPEFATAKLVDWRLRNALQFYDTDFTYYNTKTGKVNFRVRSISFKNLKHIEANGYFTQAFDLISKAMKVPLEELIKRADAS